MNIETLADALSALDSAWPLLMREARQVLGGELHYQAMAYHALRDAGVPLMQLGMNVKQRIENVVSERFIELDAKKHEDYRGGFEPIPDLVIFGPGVAGNWQRRSREQTLRQMLLAVEIKASERKGGRLSQAEVEGDIVKLHAHRIEVLHRGFDFLPVMMIIDVAVEERERMSPSVLATCRSTATRLEVGIYYVSRDVDFVDSPPLRTLAA